MIYTDKVITYNKGTEYELSEVIATIILSTGDMSDLLLSLKAAPLSLWREALIKDLEESLNKI